MTVACVSFGGNLMEKMAPIVLEKSTVIEYAVIKETKHVHV